MQLMIFIATYCFTICVCTIKAHAQTFSEWWQQKKTRIQYLEQQAAALEGLKNTVEKGYQIAEDGVDSIEAIKEEEYNLHYTFFESQGIIHPVIEGSPEISGILALYNRAMEIMIGICELWSDSPWLHPAEREQIIDDLNEERKKGLENIHRLTEIVEDNQLKMSDGERLEIIQSIGESADRTLSYALSYKRFVRAVIQQRRKDFNDIDDLKYLFP
jgi:hypothetical protein